MSSSIDYRDRNLSIFKILTNLTVKGFPTVIQFIEHVSVWERDEANEEINLRIRILDPDDKIITPPHSATLKSDSLSHRYLLSLNGLPITKEGKYKFNTYLKSNASRWRKVNTTFLDLRLEKNRDEK